MTRRLILGAVAAFFGALAGAALLVLLHAASPALVLSMGHDRAPWLRGLYGGERAGELTFAWTSARADLELPGLNRGVAWRFTARVRGARSDPSTLPEVTLLVDGVPAATARTSNTFEEIFAAIPARPGRYGTTVSIASSNTFVPGPGDTRTLGLQVDEIRVEPEGGALPPRRAIVAAALAAAVFGAIFGLLGATAGTAIGAAAVLALGQAAVLQIGMAPYRPDIVRMPLMAAAIGVVLLSAVAACERWRGEALRNTARFAVMFSASALYLKLLVLLHPNKPIIDALFHAHRLKAVMDGGYYFTSIAPGGYEFPYAIALYVVSLPLAWLSSDHVALLRVVVASSEAVAAVLLYWLVVRFWGDRLAGAAAVAITHLIPLSLAVQVAANQTNAFGQAAAVGALAATAALALPAAGRGRWIAATAALAGALLAHTSTFATLSGMVACAAAALWLAGTPDLRRAARLVAGALAVAVTLSIAVYYAHFGDTYRAQWERITGEVAGRAPARADAADDNSPHVYTSAGRSIPVRAAYVPRAMAGMYTVPVLVLAAVGAGAIGRRPGPDALARSLAGWTAGAAAFLVLGVLTPVDMRHYLAAIPVVAIAAAAGAVAAWRAGTAARAITMALLAWLTITSVRYWLGAVQP